METNLEKLREENKDKASPMFWIKKTREALAKDILELDQRVFVKLFEKVGKKDYSNWKFQDDFRNLLIKKLLKNKESEGK